MYRHLQKSHTSSFPKEHQNLLFVMNMIYFCPHATKPPCSWWQQFVGSSNCQVSFANTPSFNTTYSTFDTTPPRHVYSWWQQFVGSHNCFVSFANEHSFVYKTCYKTCYTCPHATETHCLGWQHFVGPNCKVSFAKEPSFFCLKISHTVNHATETHLHGVVTIRRLPKLPGLF